MLNRPNLDLKLDREFVDKISFDEVAKRAEKFRADLELKSNDRLSKLTFDRETNYKIIHITSYSQFNDLYGGLKTGNNIDYEEA